MELNKESEQRIICRCPLLTAPKTGTDFCRLLTRSDDGRVREAKVIITYRMTMHFAYQISGRARNDAAHEIKRLR